VSAAYAGVAGALYAHLIGFISPYDFGLQISIFLVSAIVIGGLASLPGSILGAVFLTVLFHYMSHLADIRSILYGAALIATVVFLPGGLVRWPWRWRRFSTDLSPKGEGSRGKACLAPGKGLGLEKRVEGEKGPLLEVEGLTVRFGGLVALDRVALSLNEGEIVGVIGPNGAGKTTLFNVINRFVDPEQGRVRCAGENLLRLHAHQVIELGIARTFQNIELFKNLTVLENVLIGGHRRRARWGEERRLRRRAQETLAALGIAHLAPLPSGALPLGVQKLVELARALMGQPRLLLLDEPAAGLTPKEIEELLEVLRRIHQEYGITIMVVEHHMEFVLKLCERIVVLDFGHVIASGTPAEIIAHPQVVQAYLGASGGRS
jgi:ABC-type branched-subunit amino acid transport system ATPase component